MPASVTRRDFLKLGGALTAGGALGRLTQPNPIPPPRSRVPGRKAYRLAHVTDIHVEPGSAASGFAGCLRHIHELPDPPDLILNGGDSIMEASKADTGQTSEQWRIWRQILRHECRLPIEHCLGNHDIWRGFGRLLPSGWRRQDGKKWALDELGMHRRYRSFDRAGWHFVILDSIWLDDDSFRARLDDEQFAWLEADLAAVSADTPVLVLSHIPIVSACVFFDDTNSSNNHWVVPGSWMHLDSARLKHLFHRHANVKLCLSGHMHLRDRVEVDGVNYLCNGAVCGNYWRGSYQGCPPGYGLIDLFDDGDFDAQYVTYE